MIRLCSWNIGGVKDKLQNNNILSFILNFHIIWLLETKSSQKFGVPGYTVYHNPSKANEKKRWNSNASKVFPHELCAQSGYDS